MNELNWRNMSDETPKDGQNCLTVMKHGVISGFWNEEERVFSGYYWQDLMWYANKWIPLDEITY